jgi:Domain of unknown function (DUF4258)
MSQTFEQVLALVARRDVRISEHGYDEMIQDGILARDVVESVSEGLVVEDYPSYPKGPCVLVLQRDQRGERIHVVWGIPRGRSSPAVVVTAYRPDPERWSSDFRRRRA